MNSWLDWPPFGLDSESKTRILLPELLRLTNHHREKCHAYKNILNATGVAITDCSIDAIPFIPVRLFKHLDLLSVTKEHVVKVLNSSGTSGQSVSRIFLDRETSVNQSHALIKILQNFIGVQRLPMLILDCPGAIKDRNSLSARGAGILGIANFGRDHTYVLNDEDMSLNIEVINAFLNKHHGSPILLFGFTFMIWKYFIDALLKQGRTLDLSNGVLLHGGGWKQLESESVNNSSFKMSLAEVTGIQKVHNFYGMAEQVGSVFAECEFGALHVPAFADVIIRRAADWHVMPNGEQGVIQVLSMLPESYPGHSLLTEDLGTVTGVDNCGCGRLGKTLRVDGRVREAETRGCSDTYALANRR